MSRILPLTYQLNYKTEFQTAICRHRTYKEIWVSSFEKNLLRKADTWEKPIESDINAISVFKLDKKETLAEHLPIEIFCLLTYFLKASPENKLNAIIERENRKRNLSQRSVTLTKNKTLANILSEKLHVKKKIIQILNLILLLLP